MEDALLILAATGFFGLLALAYWWLATGPGDCYIEGWARTRPPDGG
jgi:hypothetical protein